MWLIVIQIKNITHFKGSDILSAKVGSHVADFSIQDPTTQCTYLSALPPITAYNVTLRKGHGHHVVVAVQEDVLAVKTVSFQLLYSCMYLSYSRNLHVWVLTTRKHHYFA